MSEEGDWEGSLMGDGEMGVLRPEGQALFLWRRVRLDGELLSMGVEKD